ncbi:DTW domain-containing protein [Massilia terrae]|nr:tRNA-uridine aminocarboxypropyltransferase [Massilia terrae]
MCAVCERPQAACICASVVRVDSPVEVLILMHPLEVGQAKNSGRLLNLCLPASRIVVGEAFEPGALDALLHADGRRPVLLYPAEAGADAGAAPMEPSRLRLVVLDATWRKSRKMLYLNPLLRSLPRLALADVPASGYRIRKAHAPHQLSSFEAAAYALAQLTGEQAACVRLLDAFESFVVQQAAFVRSA